jgi:PAS domain S-box-containing protein
LTLLLNGRPNMLPYAPKMLPEKSARWYLEFINTIPVGVFRETLDGRIVFCNNALAEMFGFRSSKELTDYPVINLYGSIKARDSFLAAVIRNGRVLDVPLSFKKKDTTPIWCSVSARATLEQSGPVVHLDGVIRDITKDVTLGEQPSLLKIESPFNDFVVLLDAEGDLLDINRAGADLLGFKKQELLGKPIAEFIAPKFRDLFHTFLSLILRAGREEGILTIMDRNGDEQNLEFRGFVQKKAKGTDYILLMARNVTERIRNHKEQLSKEKFLGVIEMAGGVAHRLNQPLTIIGNTINEVLSSLNSVDPNYEKMVRIYHQIQRINELANKIVNIKKYEPMDYVAGVKIVDIDKTS